MQHTHTHAHTHTHGRALCPLPFPAQACGAWCPCPPEDHTQAAAPALVPPRACCPRPRAPVALPSWTSLAAPPTAPAAARRQALAQACARRRWTWPARCAGLRRALWAGGGASRVAAVVWRWGGKGGRYAWWGGGRCRGNWARSATSRGRYHSCVQWWQVENAPFSEGPLLLAMAALGTLCSICAQNANPARWLSQGTGQRVCQPVCMPVLSLSFHLEHLHPLPDTRLYFMV